MIRKFAVLAFGIALCAMLGVTNAADEKKAEATKLTGSITCAKCDLGEADKCATVIVVKEKDKKVSYYFDKDSNKKYHGDTCKAAKDGTVVGTTGKDGDKLTITVTKLEYKK